MKILALEASTASAKAMLYDTDTGASKVISREYVGQSDSASRSADAMFEQTVAVGREVSAGERIDLVSLGGTWHSIMAADRHMEPLTSAYLWDYTGAAELCGALRRDDDYTEHFYKTTGCMVNAIYPAFKIRLLLERDSSLRSARFMSVGDYFTYRLTGEIVSTRCLTSGSGLMNIHKREYDEGILSELGISEAQLSPLVDCGAAFPLTKEGAEMLGVDAGIPVIPTNSDGGLNQVGVGALEKGVATLSVGTSGAIRLTTGAPVIPEQRGTWCYLSPKAWLSGAATNGCCNCVDWARRTLFPAGTGYEEMEQGVTDEENAPVFLPFLFGERCPGWNDGRNGGFMGLRPGHNAAELYLAVQEGVLFNIYHCYRMLTEVSGVPTKIKLSGGIVNSRRWLQMCADIFGRTMTLDSVSQGSLLGACVLGMEQLGVIADASDFSPAPAGTVEPDEEKAALYKRRFERYIEFYEQ